MGIQKKASHMLHRILHHEVGGTGQVSPSKGPSPACSLQHPASPRRCCWLWVVLIPGSAPANPMLKAAGLHPRVLQQQRALQEVPAPPTDGCLILSLHLPAAVDLLGGHRKGE